MNCARCHREFSYAYSFKILNPFKHRCPDCGAILTAGRRGKLVLIGAGLLGLCIGGVAIAMEEMHLWTVYNSLLWFAIAVPAFMLPYLYWYWKWVQFEVRDDAA
jgi:DNA-directed RNA polymerase subunit RPC12/RpoP